MQNNQYSKTYLEEQYYLKLNELNQIKKQLSAKSGSKIRQSSTYATNRESGSNYVMSPSSCDINDFKSGNFFSGKHPQTNKYKKSTNKQRVNSKGYYPDETVTRKQLLS